MEAAARPVSGPGRRALPVLVLGVLVALPVFAGDASAPVPLAVSVPALVLLWAAGSTALCGRLVLPRLTREARIVLAATVALVLWTAVSALWSIAPDRTWEWFNSGLVVLAFLALGLLVGAARGGARALTAALTTVCGAALAWALLGLVIPALAPDGDRIARLREPVGYWNALALLADAGLAYATLLLAGRGRWTRVAGAALGFGAVTVVLLTQSRAGLVAGVAVLVLVLARAPRRLETGVRLLLAALPGLAVAAWVFTRPALVDDGAGRVARVDEAPLVAVALVIGLLASAALVSLVPVERAVATRAADVARALRVAIVVLLVAGVVALAVAVGNPATWAADQVGAGECRNTPGRIVELCDNNRLAWWGDALEIAAEHPLRGTGAGTFQIARVGVRDDGSAVTQPHSVPLQLLADLGVVGLALGLAVVIGVGVGIRRTLRRLDGDAAWTATVLAALPLAWGLHALVDYDLDLVAVTAPAALATGTVLTGGLPVRRSLGGAPAVAVATGLALIAVGSLVLPELSRRAVDEVYRASDLAIAADAARRARALNPLALDPITAQAFVAERAGDTDRAVELLELATRKQPLNPAPWLALARFHYLADPPDYCAAYEAFNAAYTLDQMSDRWVPGGPLDVSRDEVNAGACERARE
jgi:O-antigen ligase